MLYWCTLILASAWYLVSFFSALALTENSLVLYPQALLSQEKGLIFTRGIWHWNPLSHFLFWMLPLEECSVRVRASRIFSYSLNYSLKSSFLTSRLCCQLITDEACSSNTLHRARRTSDLKLGRGKSLQERCAFQTEKKKKGNRYQDDITDCEGIKLP